MCSAGAKNTKKSGIFQKIFIDDSALFKILHNKAMYIIYCENSDRGSGSCFRVKWTFFLNSWALKTLGYKRFEGIWMKIDRDIARASFEPLQAPPWRVLFRINFCSEIPVLTRIKSC